MLDKNYIKIPKESIIKKYNKENEIFEDNKLTIEIFNKYHIPPKYQAIILRNCYTLLSRKCDMYELTTNKEFTLNNLIVNKKGIPTIIGCFSTETLTFINGQFVEYSNQEVIGFMNDLINEKLAKNYVLAINEILSRKLTNHKINNFLIRTLKKNKSNKINPITSQ